MNAMGKILNFSSFGESHGAAIGGIVSGYPAGIKINHSFLQHELNKRKGGSKFATPRKEDDEVEILSGVFNDISTGTPIGFLVRNNNIKSKDYDDIKDIYRPSHADFTYQKKYGIRDYRGGGRSSARESVARVFAGALAKLLLNEFNIKIYSLVYGIGNIQADLRAYQNTRGNFEIDIFDEANESEIFALKDYESSFKNAILEAKNNRNSIGASILICAKNVPAGLGEPMGYKLDSIIAHSLMGLNAIKAVEIGSGIESSSAFGFDNNDFMDKNGFKTNNSGGILGGISNGNDLIIKAHFKPTPSIFLEQDSIDSNNNEVKIKLQGRHDPCVGVRGSVVANALVALNIADCLMLRASNTLENLKKIYK